MSEGKGPERYGRTEGREEEHFLSEYEQEKYERPSVAADIVTITIRKGKSANFRRAPKRYLSLLLVKRGQHPFRGCWALPGGFLRKGESIEECALRELREETGVDRVTLLPLECFSDPGRDPRGWIISNAFISAASHEQYQLTPKADAADAKWFDVRYRLVRKDGEARDAEDETLLWGDAAAETDHLLTLTDGELTIRALLRERRCKFGKIEFEILESEGIAFDHAKIIAAAIHKLRKEIHDNEIGFEFVQELFTLAELQQVYEVILDESLLTPNFRRKLSEYVEATEEVTTGAGHRPAKLFRRKEGAPRREEH